MALKWFTSYLSCQFQEIKIRSTLSELCELLFGLSQGSVLGRLLYSLYTTPLSKIVEIHPNIKFQIHADASSCLFLCLKNAALAIDKLNPCLLEVRKWMSSSVLKLNPYKTGCYGREFSSLKYLIFIQASILSNSARKPQGKSVTSYLLMNIYELGALTVSLKYLIFKESIYI